MFWAKAVKDLTPIEAWSEIKPIAEHLKICGFVCYIHIPEQKKHKLEEKSAMRIFMNIVLNTKFEISDQFSPESPHRRLRPLGKIYECCNYISLKFENYAAVMKESIWMDAMKEKIKMIENNTWELVPCPNSKEVIGVK